MATMTAKPSWLKNSLDGLVYQQRIYSFQFIAALVMERNLPIHRSSQIVDIALNFVITPSGWDKVAYVYMCINSTNVNFLPIDRAITAVLYCTVQFSSVSGIAPTATNYTVRYSTVLYILPTSTLPIPLSPQNVCSRQITYAEIQIRTNAEPIWYVMYIQYCHFLAN